MATTETVCARHPDVSTRLRCSECDTPICPRCSVTTSVGQKCPACAKQPRAAVRQGKPRQFLKAALAGGLAAGVVAFALPLVWQLTSGFFRLLVTVAAGYGIGRAVRWGAEGNGLPPFRNLAIGLAVVGMVLLFVTALGTLVPGGTLLLAYPAAAYGAYLPFR